MEQVDGGHQHPHGAVWLKISGKKLVVLSVGEMLQLNVALPSGRSETFSLLQSSKVGDLRVLAQKSFQCGCLRLVTANNHNMVNPMDSLQAAGLQDGDHLTAIAIPAKVAATEGAIALWCCGGNRVVTWGAQDFGGDSSGVKDQLKGVQQVHATLRAFAAILADGSVVAWGDRNFGGDSSRVKDQLKGVQQVHANFGAFAAILADESVVAWGHPDCGGDSSGVKDQLKGVQQVHATDRAFAAILADGSVVTWGDRNFGWDSSRVKDQLKGVQQVHGTGRAFAAILADGSVVTWGDRNFGGDSSRVKDQLKGVQQVHATSSAFAAILADGSIVTWGDRSFGGDSSRVKDQLKGVQQVHAISSAFAAILTDGSVVTWGVRNCGGDSSGVKEQLKGVQQVHATDRAFAAILADGSIVTWGSRDFGGDSSRVKDQLKGVQQVHGTGQAFAAILADGSVVTWGGRDFGGDSSGVKDQLKTVQQVEETKLAFVAILADGSFVTWGSPRFPSDSSAIAAQAAWSMQRTACRGHFDGFPGHLHRAADVQQLRIDLDLRKYFQSAAGQWAVRSSVGHFGLLCLLLPVPLLDSKLRLQQLLLLLLLLGVSRSEVCAPGATANLVGGRCGSSSDAAVTTTHFITVGAGQNGANLETGGQNATSRQMRTHVMPSNMHHRQSLHGPNFGVCPVFHLRNLSFANFVALDGPEPTKMELCTEQGYLRGEHMAAEFGPEGQYPMPNRLYARRLKRGVYTSRDLFLLWPLAQRLRLLVNTTFDEGGALGLVRSLESEREAQCLSGRSEETVLVAWDHCSLPALAQALGCDEEQCLDCWDDGNFDKLLWLRFTAVPKSKQKLSWNLTTRAVSEHFAPPQGFMGYRECLGNPAESSNYGFACKPLQAWKSLPNHLTGLH
eukprot:s1425_g13.t1